MVEVGIAGVLVPVPDREGRRARQLPAKGSVPKHARCVERVRLEEEDPEAERRAEQEAADVRDLAPRRSRQSGYDAQRGRRRRAANLVHAPSARKSPRAGADMRKTSPQIKRAGMIASFEFELETY